MSTLHGLSSGLFHLTNVSAFRAETDDFPTLQFRLWRAFLDLHEIADLEIIRLIMRVKTLRAFQRFLENRMLEGPFDADDDRLRALVANDRPLQNAFRH